MGQGYLIDSNTAIDYHDDKLPAPGGNLIDNTPVQISVIARMELLSWPKANEQQIKILRQFINESPIHNLDEPIILKAIEIRKANSIKLPDAIIAATAIVYNLILVTRNTTDFKKVAGLEMVNPYTI